MGFVKVSEALSFGEGKVFPAREGFCKAKTSDGRFARVANAALGKKYRLEKKEKW
jgi:hypothetical protein